ncbi:MAG: thiol-disulfide oxidoreductase DCC family protein [Halioglobus sp.]
MIEARKCKVVEENEHIILFDGLCNLCSAWVKFVVKRDPKSVFRFCSVQSNSGKEVLTYLGLSVEQIETMAYVQHGQGFLRSTAFLQVVKKLSAFWPLLSVGLYVPVFIRDKVYNLIAKNRYRIAGKRDHCLIQAEGDLERFL